MHTARCVTWCLNSFRLPLQAYDVKISSDEKVAQDDLRTAAVDFDTALRTSDAFLETKMSDMTRQLDVTVLKIAETCKVLTEQLNEGAFIDPHCGTSQFPTVAAVLEGLEAVRARVSARRMRSCGAWVPRMLDCAQPSSVPSSTCCCR